MADARTGRRFPVELPIRIHVSDSDQEQAGTTANVSSGGVYIKAARAASAHRAPGESPWQCGAMVEFDMTLPAKVIGAREDVHIQCRGRIVRVEQLDDEHAGNGVACVIDKYEFLRRP